MRECVYVCVWRKENKEDFWIFGLTSVTRRCEDKVSVRWTQNKGFHFPCSLLRWWLFEKSLILVGLEVSVISVLLYLLYLTVFSYFLCTGKLGIWGPTDPDGGNDCSSQGSLISLSMHLICKPTNQSGVHSDTHFLYLVLTLWEAVFLCPDHHSACYQTTKDHPYSPEGPFIIQTIQN